METKVTIKAFISDNYEKLQKIAKRELRKKQYHLFDEDIFHDTLYKCMTQLDDTLLTQDEIIAYFTRAIQVNIVRDSLYAYNTLRSNEDFSEIDEPITFASCIAEIDYKHILEDIKETFDIEHQVVFRMWAEGFTVKEINKELKIKTARYKVDKLKEWVKTKYKELEVEYSKFI